MSSRRKVATKSAKIAIKSDHLGRFDSGFVFGGKHIAEKADASLRPPEVPVHMEAGWGYLLNQEPSVKKTQRQLFTSRGNQNRQRLNPAWDPLGDGAGKEKPHKSSYVRKGETDTSIESERAEE